ncbi:MAG: hypothetical protein EG826_18295, partial [Deltaproteobacteria bacterium]|nr:hypothetical protein [Deltaproteobacteria bacterium]
MIIEDLRARGYYPLRVKPAPKGSTATRIENLPEPFSMARVGMKEIGEKMTELENGNEAAYAEVLQLFEKSFEYIQQHADTHSAKLALKTIKPVHDSLVKAGSPAAAIRQIRENKQKYNADMDRAAKGDVEILREKAVRIGPGWLSSVGAEQGRAEFKKVYGDIYLLHSTALMFHEIDTGSTAVKLCVPSEIKS